MLRQASATTLLHPRQPRPQPSEAVFGSNTSKYGLGGLGDAGKGGGGGGGSTCLPHHWCSGLRPGKSHFFGIILSKSQKGAQNGGTPRKTGFFNLKYSSNLQRAALDLRTAAFFFLRTHPPKNAGAPTPGRAVRRFEEYFLRFEEYLRSI